MIPNIWLYRNISLYTQQEYANPETEPRNVYKNDKLEEHWKDVDIYNNIDRTIFNFLLFLKNFIRTITSNSVGFYFQSSSYP